MEPDVQYYNIYQFSVIICTPPNAINKNDEMDKTWGTNRGMSDYYNIVTGRPEVNENMGYEGSA
jgi:hypothetical protein